MKSVTIKVNKNVPGHPAGSEVVVETDRKGTPLLKFWRDRLQDAKTDRCVEIIKPETKSKKPTEAAK